MQRYYEFVLSVRSEGWTEDEAKEQLQHALDQTFGHSAAARVYDKDKVV